MVTGGDASRSAAPDCESQEPEEEGLDILETSENMTLDRAKQLVRILLMSFDEWNER